MLTSYLMHRARTRNSYALLMGAIMNALLALHLLPLLKPHSVGNTLVIVNSASPLIATPAMFNTDVPVFEIVKS